jgi:CRP-like cAMP-binding protein
MDDLDILAASELFAGVPKERLEPLAPALRRRTFGRGTYLFRAGDPPAAAYIVITGLIKSTRVNADGEEVINRIYGTGEAVGHFWLLDDGGQRMYDCIAIEDSDVLVIAREPLQYLLERNPKLLRRLATALLGRLRLDFGEVSGMRSGDIGQRLARQLAVLSDHLGKTSPEGTRIAARVTQSTLAGLIGASRENVNRALVRLTADGVIDQRDGFIVIRDEAALRRRAEV